jgi:hypothetical protein
LGGPLASLREKQILFFVFDADASELKPGRAQLDGAFFETGIPSEWEKSGFER